MTAQEVLTTPYLWSAAHGTLVLTIALLFPVATTLLAWFLRGGRMDEYGLFVADSAAGVAMLVFAVSSIIFAASSLVLNEMQTVVLITPVVGCLLTVFGVSRVFRLQRLYTDSLVQDVLLFTALLWVARWCIETFSGLNIIVIGNLTQILILLIAGFVGLIVLFQRVFGKRSRKRSLI